MRFLGSKKLTLLSLGILLLAANMLQAGESVREQLVLDVGWKFYLGDNWGTAQRLSSTGLCYGPADPTFCDASWRTVNLPHDWAVEMPFDSTAEPYHSFKPLGRTRLSEVARGIESASRDVLLPATNAWNSIGWYRRTFHLPKEDAGKRLWLEFDGVQRDCIVFVNGFRIGHHESGVNSFRFDITDVARCGSDNVVTVRVDATEFEGWYYEGAGIYRHVWLEKTARLAIPPDGIFVYSRFKDNVPKGSAEIRIETALQNLQTNPVEVVVSHEIFNPAGRSVAKIKQSLNIGPTGNDNAKNMATLANFDLWSPESPKLYKLVTTVKDGGKTVDRKETEFGIRTIAFDSGKGFLLNGKPYAIKGTCNHQDHAGVGVALPDALQYFRIAKLKEMGCNAYRPAHGTPTPELLEACDRLGMLVMDENRLLDSSEENLARLEQLVRRDRNHPSVFLWNLGNEERIQNTPTGGRIAETMLGLIHRLDPTRSATCAVNLGNEWEGVDRVIDVRGWNYNVGPGMDEYHRQHPDQPNIGTEQASDTCTRGIYENDAARGYLSAYNPEAAWWNFFAERSWLSGGFVWSGFDYRGEVTPYNWPNISSHYGILDTCGFPKDIYYYYQSCWGNQPVLHLMPHWNWPGKEGQEVTVRAYSNCEEVELFLNSQSLGRQAMKKNSRLEWKVKYAPGVLSAKGFKGGKQIAETEAETTGQPAAIRLAPDRSSIQAEGTDLSIVTVSIADANGRIVPTANSLVHFKLSGPGRIIGVGNGDPSCHESDVCLGQPATRFGSMNLWRFRNILTTNANTNLLENFSGIATERVVDVGGEPDTIHAGETGCYQARLFVSDQDLETTNVFIRFGASRGEGWMYVNDTLVGQTTNEASALSFNVRNFLHAGINTVSAMVKCAVNSGGIGQGVSVAIHETPAAADWQRSAFNGLAQVIIQSTKEAGEIRLTANADQLSSATVIIHSGTGQSLSKP